MKIPASPFRFLNIFIAASAYFSATVMLQAYPENYGPYEPGTEPATYEMKTMTCLTNSEETTERSVTVLADPDQPARQIRVTWNQDDQFDIESKLTFMDADGTLLLQDQLMFGVHAGQAVGYKALLNEDDVPDYVVITWAGGCGLAAETGFYTFLLSTDGGFIVLNLETTAPDTQDFVDLDNNGRPELIQTTFIYGEPGKNGSEHNYWVHNLLRFDGDRLADANSLDPRFPMWILYTHKENHQPTDQLTPEQRHRLWNKHKENSQ